MANQVSIEQGIQNLINSEGSKRRALNHAHSKLSAYRSGFMRNASDAQEAIAWYEAIVRRLAKMVR